MGCSSLPLEQGSLPGMHHAFQPPKSQDPPQQILNEFWQQFFVNESGMIHILLPADHQSPDADMDPTLLHGQSDGTYTDARERCIEAVKRIVEECGRTNERFTDTDFDIHTNLFNEYENRDCLRSLHPSQSDEPPDSQPSLPHIKESIDILKDSGSSEHIPLAQPFFSFAALQKILQTESKTPTFAEL